MERGIEVARDGRRGKAWRNPPKSQPSIKRRARFDWDWSITSVSGVIVAIGTIVAVTVAIVDRLWERSSAETLVVATFEYAYDAKDVEVLAEYLPGKNEPIQSVASFQGRPLDVILENESEDSVTIDEIRINVYEVIYAPYCGPARGGHPSYDLNYDFKLTSSGEREWSQTNPQNLTVMGGQSGRLSITIGPSRTSTIRMTLWRFSLTAVLSDGTELPLGNGVGTDFDGPPSLLWYYLVDNHPLNDGAQVNECAKRGHEAVREFVDRLAPEPRSATNPQINSMLAMLAVLSKISTEEMRWLGFAVSAT